MRLGLSALKARARSSPAGTRPGYRPERALGSAECRWRVGGTRAGVWSAPPSGPCVGAHVCRGAPPHVLIVCYGLGALLSWIYPSLLENAFQVFCALRG